VLENDEASFGKRSVAYEEGKSTGRLAFLDERPWRVGKDEVEGPAQTPDRLAHVPCDDPDAVLYRERLHVRTDGVEGFACPFDKSRVGRPS